MQISSNDCTIDYQYLNLKWNLASREIKDMRRAVDTQDQLCVRRVGLSLQRSNENVDKAQPQWEKWYRLVVGPSILLIKFAFQQNLKHNRDLLEIWLLSFI